MSEWYAWRVNRNQDGPASSHLLFKEEIVMGDLMLMRQTPVSLLRDWLAKNTESLRMVPERDIILQARLAVPEISQMDNGDIAWEIHQWAKTHSYLPVDLPGVPTYVTGSSGATPVRAGDPEIIDRLESLLKTLKSVPTEIKWTGKDASAAITVSGATATLGNLEATAGWDRTLELKTSVSGMEFSGKIDPGNKNWEMTFTIGNEVPNLSDVANVFQKGESALRGVVLNAGKVDLQNPSKTVQQFKPYVDPIKEAVDAASKIAKQRPGDISFGVSLKGPLPNAPSPGGVTVTAVITIVF
jgi:hypothetical protein